MRPHALALVLLAASLVLAAEGAKPIMHLAGEEWDFGTLEQGQVATKDIEITNRGDADLQITFVRSTCAACVGNVAGARLIKPGEKGTVTLTFYSKGLTGRQSKVVYVHSNDPATPYKAVRIVGTVQKSARPEIAVAADVLDVGLVAKGRDTVRAITVSNTGQAPLTLTAAASDGCRVELPEAKAIDPGGRADVRVTLLGAKLAGLIQRYVTLHTNDPVTPSKTVSLVGYAADASQLADAPACSLQIVPAGEPVRIPGTGRVFARTWRITNHLGARVICLLRNAEEPQPMALTPGETRTLTLPAAVLDPDDPAAAHLDLSLRLPAALPKE